MTVPAKWDCPPCPAGCGNLGTPAHVECGVEPGRWYGPEDATLFCPACGKGWIGTAAEVVKAWEAWNAYEAELNAGTLELGK